MPFVGPAHNSPGYGYGLFTIRTLKQTSGFTHTEIIIFGGARQIKCVHDNDMCYGLVLQIVYPLIQISLYSFLLCKLFLLLTMSALECYKL